ncbi:MAG: ATP-grasp domain-containing protein [Acidimicrobiia bacterium]|nr:ATP-grasp domain-containing protein [Acidimicrobiia bacterium]
MAREITRLAIVNRGEPAMRLLHAVAELNGAHGAGPRPMTTIAFYTDPDAGALFVREADESVALGPATFRDPVDGSPKSRYLDCDLLEAELRTCRADAVWVGWGFVAEVPEFAAMCERIGVTFVGPPAAVMERLGDKIEAKRLAEAAGVPVAPWSGGPVETADAARRHAEALGLPVVVKASAGGGGRGIRVVRDLAGVEAAFRSARAEAGAAFGDPTVFVESMLQDARHVEVQVLADEYGTVWPLGVRDCSVQRRNQKIVEESASVALTPEEEADLAAAAARLCADVGYVNAGTVEFLFHEPTRTFAFLEVNTRLQVEHPVTELVTGFDLVKAQLHVAAGGALEGAPPQPAGHAIEVRLCAEDPDRDFAPAPGRIERFRLPTGPGIRVDTGFREGDEIPADFDSMIAKVQAWGAGRDEALARLRKAVRTCQVVIAGGTTNKAFLSDILASDAFAAGSVDVGWLDRGAGLARRPHADVALVVAAVEACTLHQVQARARFLASASRGRPQVSDELGWSGELRVGGEAFDVEVRRVGPQSYRVAAGTSPAGRVEVAVEVRRLDTYERRVAFGGQAHRVVVAQSGPDILVDVDGAVHRVSRDDGGVVRAPAPAVVVDVVVDVGDAVSEGDRLVVVESMKMETAVVAPFAGTVRAVNATPNTQVDAGAALVQLEATGAGDRGGGGARAGAAEPVDLGVLAAQRDRGELDRLDLLRAQVLGFDVRSDDLPAAAVGRAGEDRDRVIELEDEILAVFADIVALGRPQRDADGGDAEERSSQQWLFTYLRSIETEGAGLPDAAVTRIVAALAHYGVTSLARTPELEDALFWIATSHQRADAQAPSIAAILERRIALADELGDHDEPDESFRLLIDRVIHATQRSFPSLRELAREVRYRWFDEPLVRNARAEVYAEMDVHIAALGSGCADAERAGHVAALVDCPLPMRARLTAAVCASGTTAPEALCEVLVRRYYRERELSPFEAPRDGDAVTVTTAYPHAGRRVNVLATVATDTGFFEAAQALVPLIDSVPADEDVVVDFHLVRTRRRSLPPPRVRGYVRRVLRTLDLPRPLRRIVVMVAPADPDAGGQQYLTFRPAAEPGRDGAIVYEEDELTRGLHPMVAKRLDLWRLANFDCERLPWREDVVVFRATARENERDVRLFALAEVRDLTPTLVEGSDAIDGLPELERLLLDCLEAIRHHQTAVPVRERPVWNRVILHVLPLFTGDVTAIDRVARRMAAATEGLGLESVLIHGRMADPNQPDGVFEGVLRLANPTGGGFEFEITPTPTAPLMPLDDYTREVVEWRRRGFLHTYEFVKMLTPRVGNGIPRGDWTEHDLDTTGRHLVPVDRPPGANTAGIVAGTIRSYTAAVPEGMERVLLVGDMTRNLGAIAEDEACRIIAAIDLAEELQVPLEWFTLSSGARIAMDSGTENMDWIGRVLRRIVEFTQAGGEINVVVCGINVGAQPYWNAEATMLAHTRGILVMTPESAMVLTGKRALDFSGGVSAEDNLGIGGYERVMGPNGEAQYWAPNLRRAVELLHRHYALTYAAPGERFPRRTRTADSAGRDVRDAPHAATAGTTFTNVGEVFDEALNPDRKKPFDIRTVVAAVADSDADRLERWAALDKGDTAVVWDTRLGGNAVCLIGIESRPLVRHGFVPADGPDQWTAGTLFPQSSKKVSRAINAASGNRPVVILANLAGFDGSPESLRNLQLEHGAEIGRAVVNFDGPIVFCVVSRYHGGAFVVFSATLNDEMQVIAVEGAKASVIGGAPAAAVVFSQEVADRTRTDARVRAAEELLESATPDDRAMLRSRLEDVLREVRSEKLGEVASEFDAIHSIERAQKVGSVHDIVPAQDLRPALIEAVERGMRSASH